MGAEGLVLALVWGEDGPGGRGWDGAGLEEGRRRGQAVKCERREVEGKGIVIEYGGAFNTLSILVRVCSFGRLEDNLLSCSDGT